MNEIVTRKRAQKTISEQECLAAAYLCNLRCVYCQNPADGRKPDPKKEAAGLRTRGVRAVSLEGGGEPTVGPLFRPWLKELRAAGVKHIMLSTNVVALADPELCREAARAVDYFTVNFPSHDPDVYARTTRSVKYPKAIRGLENLKSLGMEAKVRLFHIVYRGNYRLLPSFADWVGETLPGLAFVNLTFVRNRGRVRDSAEIVPRYSEAAPFIKLALLKLKRKGIRSVIQNMPLCQLKGLEGFCFEYHRWHRGDKVLEAGLAAAATRSVCGGCALRAACCGARRDYLKIHGSAELEASGLDPALIKPERF